MLCVVYLSLCNLCNTLVRPRMEQSMQKLASKKFFGKSDAEEPETVPSDASDDEHVESAAGNSAVDTSTAIHSFAATSKDLGHIKNWLMENFGLCLSDPSLASQNLRNKIQLLVEQNSSLASVIEDLDLGDGVINFGMLGQQLRQKEEERHQVQQDLEKAGPGRRRPGRPFGSSKKRDLQAEGDGEPVKKRKKTKSENKDKSAEDEPPEETGPFDDCEDEKTPNKCSTISLYSKCLVIEVAKQIKESGQYQNVEKEVMMRFKKYFYSFEQERWKTGLLGKWWKYLVCVDVNFLHLQAFW